jgi:hypothetical protein
MIYVPSQKEFEAVTQLNIDKRVKHFVNRVGGNCYMWLCCDNDDSLLLGYDKNGRECLMVWPAKKYAELVFPPGNEARRYLKNMEIHKFLEEYIDELSENNTYIFVFPNKELNGAIMTAESFRNMMQEELDRME